MKIGLTEARVQVSERESISFAGLAARVFTIAPEGPRGAGEATDGATVTCAFHSHLAAVSLK